MNNIDNQKQISSIMGCVAEILSDSVLVISKGEQDGVKRGMLFAIVSKNKNPLIHDPENGSLLGELPDYVKAVVGVFHVSEKMSLAKALKQEKLYCFSISPEEKKRADCYHGFVGIGDKAIQLIQQNDIDDRDGVVIRMGDLCLHKIES